MELECLTKYRQLQAEEESAALGRLFRQPGLWVSEFEELRFWLACKRLVTKGLARETINNCFQLTSTTT